MADFKHIVRIANTDLDGNKLAYHALTKIKGVGTTFAASACIIAKIPRTIKAGNLSPEQVSRLTEIITNPAKSGYPPWMLNRRKDVETDTDRHLLTSDIDLVVGHDIRRMKKTKSNKGMRHHAGLPLRGQRTRSNFRRNKGKVQGVKRGK